MASLEIIITNTLSSLIFFLLITCPSLAKSQTLTLTDQSSTLTHPSPAPKLSPPARIIERACKYCYDAGDRKFCEQTLESDPPASRATTTLALAQAALELMLSDAIDEQSRVAEYSKEAKEKAMRDALRGCAEGYAHVVASFHSARGELDGHADTANYDVYVSLDWVRECEAGLASTGLSAPPVSASSVDR